MIKLVTLAALAAFAAVPANASEIRVSLVGKSAEQIDTDITAAARSVCQRDSVSSPIYRDAYVSCVRDTLKAAKAQLSDVAAR